MKAQLKKDIIVWGASGLSNTNINAQTEDGKAFVRAIKEQEKKFDAKYTAYARKHSVPAQEVDVIRIYDQAEVAKYYSTPTWHEIVALVSATNFDGEIVEIVVGLTELVGVPDDPNRVMSIVAAGLEWSEIIKLFGSK